MNTKDVINKIDNIVKDVKEFKIGMTSKAPNERLSMPDYKDKFAKIIPICSSPNEKTIEDLEKNTIEKFIKLYPEKCKNDQFGGGEMTKSEKYYLYVVLNN
ncbi:MAG: hypothetical protein ABSD71_00220 [Bacteroidales bacterium]